MHIDHNMIGNICVLTIEGSITPEEAFDIQSDVEHLVNDECIRHVIVDSRQAGLFHSADVGWLLLVFKELELRQIGMSLCHLNSHNRAVIHMTKLDDLMNIYETLEDALTAEQVETQDESMPAVIPPIALFPDVSSRHSGTPHPHLY